MTLPTPYFERDGCVIYHADCREILPHLAPVDLVLADPPYDIVAKGGGIGARRQYLHDIHNFTDGGFDVSALSAFPRWMVFCGMSQLVGLIGAAKGRWCLLTWNKPNPTPLVNGNYLPDTEYIVHSFPSSAALFGKYAERSRFILHPCGQRKTRHPNEKPMAVMKRLVAVGSDKDETILDPFAGSCTTGVAARDLGRKCIMVEIEEPYCEIGARRLSQGVLPFGGGA